MKPWELYYRIWHTEYKTGKLDLQYTLLVHNDTLYVIFQPTHSVLDWLINLLSALPFFRYAFGWHLVWMLNEKQILEQVESMAVGKYGLRDVVVTGHSYGGAVAVSAGIAIRNKLHIAPALITFGCPNALMFNKGIKCKFKSVEQWACKNDVVTYLPSWFKNVEVKRIGEKFKKEELFKVEKWHYSSYFKEETYMEEETYVEEENE